MHTVHTVPLTILIMLKLFAQNGTKQYVPEEQEYLPHSEERHLPYGEECEASSDSAYISTTRDDSSTSSIPSETADSSDHESEDHADIDRFGEQEENYCQNDTVQQLKAVNNSTLVLERNAPQPLDPVSCSDVSEETGYEPLAKVDNQSTQFSISPQPSMVNGSQTQLHDTSTLPRQQKPSGKTKISGHGDVTNHRKHVSIGDTDEDEDITKPNDQPSPTATNVTSEQSNSMEDYVQGDHQPDPFMINVVFIVLPDPLGSIAVLYMYNMNVSESHERH